MLKNKTFTKSEILEQINSINFIFRKSRSAYPYLADKHIGKTGIVSFDRTEFHFIQPLSRETQIETNKIGHFLNQNFIVRLFAVLQYYGIFNNLDEIKYKRLTILKGLRNKFGHSLGTYNPENSKDRKLLQQMIAVFNLPKKNYKDFPISVDTVINSVIQEAKQYVKEHYR